MALSKTEFIENFVACAAEINPSRSVEELTTLAGIVVKTIVAEECVELRLFFDHDTFATLHLR